MTAPLLLCAAAATAAVLAGGGPAHARPEVGSRPPAGAPPVAAAQVAAQVAAKVTAVRVTEGGTASVRFTLAKAVKKTTKLTAQTVDGTAKARGDYRATRRTVTVKAKGRTATVKVATTQDALHEATETFTVVLKPARGKALTATVTITDDDAVPALSVEDSSLLEDAGTMPFTVRLSAPSALPVTVGYATTSGDAASGYDFTATNGVLTLPPGTTSAVVGVPVVADTKVEPDETFTMTLRRPTGAVLGREDATGTILHDDLPGLTPTTDAATAQRREGDTTSLVIPVVLSDPAPVPVTFTVLPAAPVNGHRVATAGTDYRVQTGTVRIEAGQALGEVVVQVLQDDEPEPTEPVELTLSGLTGTSTSGTLSAVGSITDDGDQWVARLQPLTTPLVAPECTAGPLVAATRRVEGRVTLNGTPWAAGLASFDVVATPGTASSGSDFTVPQTGFAFGAGQSSVVVGVDVACDAAVEPDETFSIGIGNPSGLTVAPDAAGFGVTLLNDDGAHVTVDRPQVDEGAASVTWTVTLDTPQTDAVVVTWATDATGTATPLLDFVPGLGTCTIPAGATTCTFSVGLTDDGALEPTESVAVLLSTVSPAVLSLPTHAYADLLDDDGGPGVGHLVINEVDYEQPGADTAEFVEVYNPTSVPVDLNGYQVIGVDGATDNLPTGSLAYAAWSLGSAGVLPAHSYVVLADPGVTVPAGVRVVRLSGDDDLRAGGPHALALASSAGVVDALSYEGAVRHANGFGLLNANLVEGDPLSPSVRDNDLGDRTLARYPDGLDTDDASVDWIYSDYPTPGESNQP